MAFGRVDTVWKAFMDRPRRISGLGRNDYVVARCSRCFPRQVRVSGLLGRLSLAKAVN